MLDKPMGLIAQIKTANFTVEVIQAQVASPCDMVLSETRHLVAMQRQRLQSFSTGRFDASPKHAAPGQGRASAPAFENLGRIIALPKGRELHVIADGGYVESVRCLFSPQTLRRIVGRDWLVEDGVVSACLNLKCPTIARLMAKLADEAEQPGALAELMIDALGQALVIELVRYLDRQNQPSAARRGGLSQRTLRQIAEFANARDGAVSLGELSEMTGYSARHLTRTFKQSTGQTINDFVSEIRLKRAIELLTEGRLSIREIAAQLGFGSSGAFCVSFTRCTGESPARFRTRERTSREKPVRGRKPLLKDGAAPQRA